MDRFKAVTEEVKSLLANARGSHDWEHIKRVYNLSMRIASLEKADTDVLKYAALLHDIGREEQDKSNGAVCHAKVGAMKARKILEKHGFDSETIEKVAHCIEAHRSRGNKIPGTIEAKILFDADKLDGIGAIGVGRAFVFSGEIGAKVHNKDVDVENTEEYTSEDTAYREFLVSLSKTKKLLYTNEGKRIAQGRHDFMVEFFNRINKEVDGEL